MRIAVIVLPVLLFVCIIPVMIGVYVYRDANRRGMNAALWTLVAILAPSLIGFIIYLLVRGNYSNLKCPRCGTIVRDEYLVCPNCGTKLQPTCSNCGAGVETDWKVCPRCAQPLSQNFGDVAMPYRPKDRGLSKILIIIIIIPVLLIMMMILAVCGYSFFSLAGDSNVESSSVSGTSLAEFNNFEESDEWEEVKSWIASLDDEEEKAYVMRHVTKVDSKNTYYYLVYMPSVSDLDGFGYKDRGSKKSFVMEFYEDEYGEAMLYGAEALSSRDLNLEIYFNDRKMECEIIDVDFNPACFWFGTDYQIDVDVDIDR